MSSWLGIEEPTICLDQGVDDLVDTFVDLREYFYRTYFWRVIKSPRAGKRVAKAWLRSSTIMVDGKTNWFGVIWYAFFIDSRNLRRELRDDTSVQRTRRHKITAGEWRRLEAEWLSTRMRAQLDERDMRTYHRTFGPGESPFD